MKKSKRFVTLCKKYGVDPDQVPEILSYEAACEALRLSPENLPSVGKLPARHRKRIVADYKLTIIAEALQNGWRADYTNYDQYKYYPWFKVKADKKKPSGFGLSCRVFGGWRSCTGGRRPPCFRKPGYGDLLWKALFEIAH